MAIVEDASATTLPALVVHDGRRAAAVAAATYYGDPASFLRLVGVTGTNGKTTTVGMLRHLLDAPNARPPASARWACWWERGRSAAGRRRAHHAGPIELQRLLRALVDAGVRAVAMEASSHALDQGRVEGLRFAAAVFTNLTRDHLDYHRTFEAYFWAKAMLVGHLTADGVVVSNADDPVWADLPDAPRTLRFGVQSATPRCAPSRWSSSRAAAGGTLVRGGERADVALPLIGDFNVANALGRPRPPSPWAWTSPPSRRGSARCRRCPGASRS